MDYEKAEIIRDFKENEGIDMTVKQVAAYFGENYEATQKVLRHQTFVREGRSTEFCDGGIDAPLRDRLKIEKALCQDLDTWAMLLYSKKLGEVGQWT